MVNRLVNDGYSSCPPPENFFFGQVHLIFLSSLYRRLCELLGQNCTLFKYQIVIIISLHLVFQKFILYFQSWLEILPAILKLHFLQNR